LGWVQYINTFSNIIINEEIYMKTPLKFTTGLGLTALIFASLLVYVSATGFNVSISPSLTNSSNGTELRFNVTIFNNETEDNVTEVWINIANNLFYFIEGTNDTSVTDHVFTNSTPYLLKWNATNQSVGMIPNMTEAYFLFNTTPQLQSGTYNFTVTVYANGTSDSKTVNVTIDNDKPSVSLISPANNSRQALNDVVFKFNVTDVSDVTCNLYVNGSSVNSTVSKGTDVEMAAFDLPGGQHNWTVWCEDQWGNLENATETRWFGFYPDLVVDDIEWSSENNRTTEGSNITSIYARIKNQGDFDFNHANNFTIKLYWNNELKSITNVTENLTAGYYLQKDLNVMITSMPFNVSGHHLRAEIDTVFNGSVVAEEADLTNNYLTESVFTGYNVTVLNITPTANPNSTLAVQVQVLYANGESATGLGAGNFSFYDSGKLENITGFDDSQHASGIYSFNTVSYGFFENYGRRTLPGVHEPVVQVVNNESGLVYKGNGTGSYNLTAPLLEVLLSFNSTNYDLKDMTTNCFSITIRNVGNFNITGNSTDPIRVFMKTDKGSIPVQYPDFRKIIDNGTDMMPGESYTIGSTLPGTDYCLFGVNSATTVYMWATVNGTYDDEAYSNYWSTTLTITDTRGEEQQEEDKPPATAGATCTTDNDCATGYVCSGGKCVEYIPKLGIIGYQEEISVLYGEKVSTKVKVKNLGKFITGIKLDVDIPGVDVVITPVDWGLIPEEEFEFDISFDAKNADVGRHNGAFRLYKPDKSESEVKKDFVLVVLPTEEQKAQIVDDFQNYSADFGELETEYKRLLSLGFLNKTDTGAAEAVYNAGVLLKENIQKALDEERFTDAYTLLKDFEKNINTFGNEIAKLNEIQTQNMGVQWSGVWVWVIVIIGVMSAGGFLAYKYLPPIGGYHPKFGFRPKMNIITQIKSSLSAGRSKIQSLQTKARLNNVKNPLKDQEPVRKVMKYKSGYQKDYPYGYSFKSKAPEMTNMLKLGKVKNIKNLFKRKKQRYLSDFYAS
jgi:hypothetical protein